MATVRARPWQESELNGRIALLPAYHDSNGCSASAVSVPRCGTGPHEGASVVDVYEGA